MAVQISPHRPVEQRIAFGCAGRIPLANHGFVVEQIDRAFDEHRAGHAALCDLKRPL